MEALAEARPPGSSPTESRNEDRLEKILADAGALPLRRQVVLGGHEPVGRADFRDRDLPLVVEVNIPVAQPTLTLERFWLRVFAVENDYAQPEASG